MFVFDENQIIELTEEDKKFLELFTNIEKLSFNGCKLKSLKNFPVLPNLEQVSLNWPKLDLADNFIDDLTVVAQYKNLSAITLGGNSKLKEYKQLEPIKDLEHLQLIDLLGTPLESKPDYRATIFGMFKNLIALD